MGKQNHKTLEWILALLFSAINVISIFLPFTSARDILEPAHFMVFRTINIQELSIWGTGIVIAPVLYIAILLCTLSVRDKTWLWFLNVVLQNFSFVGAMLDVRIWLSVNTTNIEWNIGYSAYIVSAIFAATFVLIALRKSNHASDVHSLPATFSMN